MTLEDRLERLANRTPPGDPADVMAAARAHAESRPDARNPRLLAAAAAAVVAVVALAAGGLALTGGDDSDSVIAGPGDTPAQPLPSCEDVTRFADGLHDTGVMYDYDASSSPQDLADQSDAVFAGTLTGLVTHVTDEEYQHDYVGFEVAVRSHYKTDGQQAPDTVTVLLLASQQHPDGHWSDLATPGVPVVVFAHAAPGSMLNAGTSVVANGAEGIVTGCEDGPPLGLVGRQGDWPSFTTLADIEAALTPGPGSGAAEQGGVDGPVLSGPKQSMIQQGRVEGRLLLRGDCLYLPGEGGEAEWPLLPVVWPNGTTWEGSPEGVRLPDGSLVPIGAWVTASGTYEDVDGLAERGHGPAVADRAQTCDVEGTDTVAYVQGEVAVGNTDSAIEGDVAVWDVDVANPPAGTATTVAALVTRLGCSGGETGEILKPVVSADGERVVVTFSVEALPDGDYACPGNNSVPYVIELGEPLGDRELVDGACLSGDAASTSFCAEGAVRWSPPA